MPLTPSLRSSATGAVQLARHDVGVRLLQFAPLAVAERGGQLRRSDDVGERHRAELPLDRPAVAVAGDEGAHLRDERGAALGEGHEVRAVEPDVAAAGQAASTFRMCASERWIAPRAVLLRAVERAGGVLLRLSTGPLRCSGRDG